MSKYREVGVIENIKQLIQMQLFADAEIQLKMLKERTEHTNLDISNLLATVYTYTNRYDEALYELYEVLGYGLSDFDTLYNLTYLKMLKEEFKQANDFLKEAILYATNEQEIVDIELLAQQIPVDLIQRTQLTEDEIAVSVIVPIYNQERYLVRCLESILKQTQQNIEIILVNDGSQDQSIKIMEFYEKYNPHVICLHQENKGLSGARNSGMRVARGVYLSFIDSDDTVESDFLEFLFNEAIKYDLDIACGSYQKIVDNCVDSIAVCPPSLIELGVVTGKLFYEEQFKKQNFRMEVWDDLYKRTFIESNHITFKENIFYEDELFTAQVLMKAKRVKKIASYRYHYYQNQGSIMNQTLTSHHFKSLVEVIEQVILLIDNFEEKNNPVLNHLDYLYEILKLRLKYCNEKMNNFLTSNRIEAIGKLLEENRSS